MRFLIINFFLIVQIISCEKTINNSNILSHDRFFIKFPSNCEHKKSKYLDTEYGEWSCKEFLISYDYGYCNYSKFTPYTKEDYIQKNRWLVELIPKLNFTNQNISTEDILIKIEILSINKDSLYAIIKSEDKIFKHNIKIPNNLINLTEVADTSDGIITRVIYNEKLMKEVNCYKINTRSERINGNCNEALIVRVSSDNKLDSLSVFNFLNNIIFPLVQTEND